MDTTENSFAGRVTVLPGARSFAYLQDMSCSLRSVRLVPHPEKLNLSEVSHAH
jgi:hypothetical protein